MTRWERVHSAFQAARFRGFNLSKDCNVPTGLSVLRVISVLVGSLCLFPSHSGLPRSLRGTGKARWFATALPLKSALTSWATSGSEPKGHLHFRTVSEASGSSINARRECRICRSRWVTRLFLSKLASPDRVTFTDDGAPVGNCVERAEDLTLLRFDVIFRQRFALRTLFFFVRRGTPAEYMRSGMWGPKCRGPIALC